MAWTINISLGLGSTGLSLKAAIYTASSGLAFTTKDIATGFTELGDGNYVWYYAAMPDSFVGFVQFYTGTIGSASNFDGVTLEGPSLGLTAQDEAFARYGTVPGGPWATGQGGGAYPLTVAVQSTSATAIVGASVAITGQPAFQTTDGSGDAGFYLNAGTVTIATSAAGYSNSGTVATILDGTWTSTGSSTLTLSMTPINISPATPSQVTGTQTTFDAQGGLSPNTSITFTRIRGTSGLSGLFAGQTFTATSDDGSFLQALFPTSSQWSMSLPGASRNFTVGTANFTIPPLYAGQGNIGWANS
ncbi:MAG TPA: hypothetical protein VHY37_07215 [Tepidisphaeraceae bacterium]|jgi:hypothetical protein|nr:hypothetical protein [Tepidisphaeraceae bacterium]